mmetsp:Transcript_16282/g.67380  ORF Transcript_16282/g.67380 Transcript_16282/m.67380 type:complete len:237 (+) Transcript_16282:2970-3680(+)
MRLSPGAPQDGHVSLKIIISSSPTSLSSAVPFSPSVVPSSCSSASAGCSSSSSGGCWSPRAALSTALLLNSFLRILGSCFPGSRPSIAELPDGSLISTSNSSVHDLSIASLARNAATLVAPSGSAFLSSSFVSDRLSITSLMIPSTVVRRPRFELGISSSTLGILITAESESSTLRWRSLSVDTLHNISTPSCAIWPSDIRQERRSDVAVSEHVPLPTTTWIFGDCEHLVHRLPPG